METILKKIKITDYVQIDNNFLNKKNNNLSWKAKGIFCYLMSKPNGWIIRVKDIIEQSSDGEKSVTSGLRELRELGYAKIINNRNQEGKFTSKYYIITEIPFQFSNNNLNLNPLNLAKKTINPENGEVDTGGIYKERSNSNKELHNKEQQASKASKQEKNNKLKICSSLTNLVEIIKIKKNKHISTERSDKSNIKDASGVNDISNIKQQDDNTTIKNEFTTNEQVHTTKIEKKETDYLMNLRFNATTLKVEEYFNDFSSIQNWSSGQLRWKFINEADRITNNLISIKDYLNKDDFKLFLLELDNCKKYINKYENK